MLEDTSAPSIDPAETARFAAMAASWWDPRGSSRLLHEINPLRLAYIRARAEEILNIHPENAAQSRRPFAGIRALDVGCGGGILSEPLARLGFDVTGIDASSAGIAVARTHARAQDLSIDYRVQSVESLAQDQAGSFDLICCLEVIEHVACIPGFLDALATLLAPHGCLILSTPNRTLASWATMILGAERILRLLPEKTHDWDKFLTPEELEAALRDAGLRFGDVTGISYFPGRGFQLGGSQAINYIGTAIPAPA